MTRSLGAADALALAAAPAFAVMAVLTAAHGGAGDMHGGSPPGGMTLMYALMSVCHLSPWLRLAQAPFGRRFSRKL